MNRKILLVFFAGLALIFSACSSEYQPIEDTRTVTSDESCVVVSDEIGNQADFNAFGTPFIGRKAYLDKARTIWLERNGNETNLIFGKTPTIGLVKIAYKDGNHFTLLIWDTSLECAQDTVVSFDGRQFSNIRYKFVDAANPDDGEEDGKNDQSYPSIDTSGVFIVGVWYEYSIWGTRSSSSNSLPKTWSEKRHMAITSGNSLHLFASESYQIENTTRSSTGSGNAQVWKNGEMQTLGNWSIANSVFVTDTDVFVAGRAGSGIGAAVWKNGIVQDLAPGAVWFTEAISVFVYNDDVYVVGDVWSFSKQNWIAKLWINGRGQYLSCGARSTFASSVFVSEGNVYVAGFEIPDPNSGIAISKLWINGQAQRLTDGRVNSWASSVFVSDQDVYVVGFEGFSARLWKNGRVQYLENGSDAVSVFIYNGDVYVAGYDWCSQRMKVWKNGNVLYSHSGRFYVTSIFVSDNNVYVAANATTFQNTGISTAKLWRNGVLQDISNGMEATHAHSIFVR